MQPISGADENELQKAINNITSSSDGGAAEQDTVAAVADKVAAGDAASAPAADNVTLPADDIVSATNVDVPSVPEAEKKVEEPMVPIANNSYGDPDLGALKTKALTDLRPLLDKVDLPPEAKFMIYREIFEATNDKAVIEPAYETVKMMEDEKEKAESLLSVVEMIDKLWAPTN